MTGRIEDYEVLEVIGTGSFGTCYKVRNRLSGKIYVWKAIDYGAMTEEKKQLLVSEVNLLSELNHPHIVKYYDRILHRETTTIYIIMEWCQGGDLASLIDKYKSRGTWVEEVFVWRVLYQTGRALQACHSHLGGVTVLHRDIKPANVFLDGRGNVKLGDFGLARILKGTQSYSQTVVGTPYYMSPEVIKGTKYDRKSDIWALGCLIYELCALSPPFVGSDMNQLATNIKDGRFDPIPSDYSEDLQRVVELMLSVEHLVRPTVEMILHHPAVVAHQGLGTKQFTDTATLHMVSDKIKALSLARGPEGVSEDTFQEKWMTRIEALRRRESNIRKREDKLIERERVLAKREKQVILVERLSKEKLARAEIYLKQCKENRLPQMPRIKIMEDLDTSLSADPGDTSILPTSAKIDPTFVPLPSNFVRSASERRFKHVHFEKRLSTLPIIQEVKQRRVLGEVKENQQNNMPKTLNKGGGIETKVDEFRVVKHSGKEVATRKEDNFNVTGAVPKGLNGLAQDKSATLRPLSLPTLNWLEERNLWLENKRSAFHTADAIKSNADLKHVELKDSKKRSSKISLFSKKSIR